jgi:hypothetical protein
MAVVSKKTCSKCKSVKTKDCFSKGKAVCKPCRASHYKVIHRAKIAARPPKVVLIVTHKPCIICHKVLPLAHFVKKRNQCKRCKSNAEYQRNKSFDNFMRMLWNSTKGSNVKRVKGGRDLKHTLTLAQLTAKWHAQDGKCYLTGMPMIAEPHSHFKCSVERIDNDVGYTDENTVLVCHEVNTAMQWNEEKVERFFGNHTYGPINFDKDLFYGARKTNAGILTQNWSVNADNTVLCHKCGITQDRSQFRVQLSQGCRACVRKSRETWKCCIDTMLCSARNNKRGLQCTLSFDDLVDILIDQKGLCYYSGHPMNMEKGDYKISLERIDPLEDYEADNVCFICSEFQSCDRTRLNESDNEAAGSCGWTKEKYDTVKENYLRCKVQ